MEQLLDFLINIVMGLLGVLIFNVIAFREHIFNKALVMSKVFWVEYRKESMPVWIWSVLVITLISLIVWIAPEVATSLTELTGWQIATNSASFLFLGWSISLQKDSKKK